jgi:hypothetical protein
MRSRSFFIVLVFRLEGDIEDKIGRFFISGVCMRSRSFFIVPVIRLAGVIEDTPPV